MKIFHEFNLTPEEERKGRKILRVLADRQYFGDVTNLLIRTVAENLDLDLLTEAEKLFEYDKGNRKKSTILRYHNWVMRVASQKAPATTLDKDKQKAYEFKRKRELNKDKGKYEID